MKMNRFRNCLFLFNKKFQLKQTLLLNFASPFSSLTVGNYMIDKNFFLNNEWNKRFEQLAVDNLAGSYDWIATVQKKFSSINKASAIDVDIAVTLADEEDQLKDIFDIVYRFRHTKNAGDLLPSTEYAVFRFFMKFNDWKTIFNFLNDTINYGIFPNEHATSIAIIRLLNENNISGAAKLASYVMQQEMYDYSFLNYISLYSLAKWIELPIEERIFNEIIQPVYNEEEFNDDEIKVFKFPFLKNDYFDNHFDLCTANSLVRKSLACSLKHLPNELNETDKLTLKNCINKILSSKDIETEPFLLDNNTKLSTIVTEIFYPILVEAEKKLINNQLNLFNVWYLKRNELIKVQAEGLNLALRLIEIKKRQNDLINQKKLLYFFEHRAEWENRAEKTDQLFSELKLDHKELEQTEQEYTHNLFENARRISQGKYTPPIIKQLNEKKKMKNN